MIFSGFWFLLRPTGFSGACCLISTYLSIFQFFSEKMPDSTAIWYILKNVPCTFEKKVHSAAVRWNVLYASYLRNPHLKRNLSPKFSYWFSVWMIYSLFKVGNEIPYYCCCSKALIPRYSAFLMVQLSHPYKTTGKTIALAIWTFVNKVMSLLFNTLSRFVTAVLPRSMHLLISILIIVVLLFLPSDILYIQMLYVFRRSNAGCINIFSYYILLMNWPLYNCIATLTIFTVFFLLLFCFI